MEYNDKDLKTLCEWHFRIRRAKRLHYKRQRRLEIYNSVFGVVIIISSILSSGFSFWSFGNDNRLIGWVATFSGVIAFALATIQLLSNFKDAAMQNYISAKDYNALQVEIEHAMSAPWKHAGEFMSDFRKDWRSVDKHAPYIPPRYYRNCKN